MIKTLTLTFTAVALGLCLFASHAVANDMDGVMMKDGKMTMMKEGKAAGAMTKDMTMRTAPRS